MKETLLYLYRGGGEGGTSFLRGLSAQDLINYETQELGNDIKIFPNVTLSNYPANRCIWVTTKKENATEYGEVKKVGKAKNYKFLARDNYGGYLVFPKYRESLQEAANFNNYKQFWNEDLFDLVKSFDPSPDNRYEAWLLDTFRKIILYEAKQTLPMFQIPREYLKFYLQTMLLTPLLYAMNSDTTARIKLFTDKFNLDVENLAELELRTRQFLDNPPVLPSISRTFNRYINSQEDRGGLIEALNIHRWLSESNRLTPEQKNISNFKTLDQLISMTQPYFQEYEEVAQGLAIGSRVQEGRDYKILLADEQADVLIVQIKTFLGSQYWGTGTSWCIKSSEEYLDLYTNNGTAPCIYYIFNPKGGPDKPATVKWAFVEGDRNKLYNPSNYIKVQYRNPHNQPLTYGDMEKIPEAHRNLLSKYLWLFQFLKGEIKIEEGQQFTSVGDIMEQLSDRQRDDVNQWLYDKAIEAFYNFEENSADLRMDYYEIGRQYLYNIKPKEFELCGACFGSGYAFTSKIDGEYNNVLTKEEFKEIYAGLVRKMTGDSDEFKNAYHHLNSDGTYSPKIELRHEEYPENAPAFKLAEKYNNTCGRCGGSGEHNDETWSHNQIDRAFEEYEDEEQNEFTEWYLTEQYGQDLDEIDEDFRSELEYALGHPFVRAFELDDMDYATNLEPVGQSLVNQNGIKPGPVQESLIKKLLRRFK